MTTQEMQDIADIHLKKYINQFMAKEDCLENLSYTAIAIKFQEQLSQENDILKYQDLLVGGNIYEKLIDKYTKLDDADKADIWNNPKKVLDKIIAA
jgi:hypothetical protein